MGRIEAICVSPAKGTVKTRVESAELRTEHGIVGDAHAGSWHRQVSLLPAESIAKVRDLMPDLADGAFAENLVTSGIALGQVTVGDRVRIGAEVELEITQIGKECHQGCAIRQITGDCIMPREGVFCRVLAGGHVDVGADVNLERAEA
ncbi:MAG: MOSC domain-containing protein [bacterium]|nr:MOSC domain-containing protein [bacterium]